MIRGRLVRLGQRRDIVELEQAALDRDAERIERQIVGLGAGIWCSTEPCQTKMRRSQCCLGRTIMGLTRSG